MVKDFNKILEMVEKASERKRDINVKLKDMVFDDATGNIYMKGLDSESGEFFEDLLPLSPTAASSFYGRLGIPASYAKSIPAHLMKPHVDYAISKQNAEMEFFVRLIKNDKDQNFVRAVLSNRYGIFDNLTMLTEMHKALEAIGANLSVKEFGMDQYADMLNIRLVDNDHKVYGVDPRGKSNPYFGGMHVINGETGMYPISLGALVWEQWCSNGAMRERYGENLLRRRHIGSGLDIFDSFKDAYEKAPAIYVESLQSFLNAQKVIVRHPYHAFYNLMKQNRGVFNDSLKVRVIESFNKRNESTRYGIASALTEAAQTQSFDKRLQAEKLAGDILFFNRPLDESGEDNKIALEIERMREKFYKGVGTNNDGDNTGSEDDGDTGENDAIYYTFRSDSEQ